MHTFSFRSLIVCVSVAVTLVTVCTVAHTARGASSQVSFFEAQIVAETDESGEVIDEHIDVQFIGSVEAGGSLALDLTETYAVNVESDALPFAYLPKGELYFIPDTTRGDREFVSAIGGDEIALFMLPSAGTYEADIYGFYNPPPQQVQKSPLWNFFAELFGVPAAHAQTSDEHPDIFVETVRFEITDANAAAACCSNVLFIPGIKGSILAKDDLVGDDVLWPPTIWSNDVSQLALTEAGESVNDVVVNGILAHFSVGPLSEPIYSPFMSFLDELVTDEVIADWEPLPYDWRFSPETILADGIKTPDGTVHVIEAIEVLAQNSDTGQVTIVAHSMGGLMGKAIIKKLEEERKEELIDAFVMVGTPQLGTPQTVLSLLHGNGEGIPNNLEGYFAVLNNSVAEPAASRALAQNMPSAYNLLPSPTYFDTVTDPVIIFDENATYTENWRNEWGDTISNYNDFRAFLIGQGTARSKPEYDELHKPEVVRADFMDNAEAIHAVQDTYVFPDHIRVVEIAGWGRPTVKGVRYTMEHGESSYTPLFTSEGDKTVVYPSAISDVADETFFFNLDLYRNSDDTLAEHKDLLSISFIQDAIVAIVEENAIEVGDYLVGTKPNLEAGDDQLIVSSHSPVILGAYDEEGNFTGIDAETETIREEIPGSTLHIIGTDQYIFLPKEGTYDFVYEGTGSGSTTVQIASFANDEVTPIVRYTDIPTTEHTSAAFAVSAAEPAHTTIVLDQNGDGKAEVEIFPDDETPATQSVEELIASLRTSIEMFDLRRYQERSLLVKVRILERVLETRFSFLRRLLSNINVRTLEFDIKMLERRRHITTAQADEVFEILDKIKEKI